MHSRTGRSAKLRAFIVTGITVQGLPSLEFRHHSVESGRVKQDSVQLPTDMARRLHWFASQHYVSGLPGFDCMAFVRYLTGYDQSVTLTSGTMGYNGPAATPTRLQTARAYVMRSGTARATQQFHGVIGLTGRLSLSVVGTDSPLVIADTPRLMTAYDTSDFMEIHEIYRP